MDGHVCALVRQAMPITVTCTVGEGDSGVDEGHRHARAGELERRSWLFVHGARARAEALKR